MNNKDIQRFSLHSRRPSAHNNSRFLSNIPVTPELPEIGFPDTGLPDFPVTPDLPNVGVPGTLAPNFPIFPIFPGNNVRYCNVRFLHAAAGYPPLYIQINSYTFVRNLDYSEASGYSRILDGFRNVTVSLSSAPRTPIFRKAIPFRGGDIVTLAIINSNDGIDIISISDLACESIDRVTSCFRVANLSYNSDPMDTKILDGNVVFTDTRFKEVTVFKPIISGYYQFIVTDNTHEPMPIISDIDIIEPSQTSVSSNHESEILAIFDLAVNRNKMYTSYFIGGESRNNPIQVVTLN